MFTENQRHLPIASVNDPLFVTQDVTKYYIIYFDRVNYILKNLTLKTLKHYFYYMQYH